MENGAYFSYSSPIVKSPINCLAIADLDCGWIPMLIAAISIRPDVEHCPRVITDLIWRIATSSSRQNAFAFFPPGVQHVDCKLHESCAEIKIELFFGRERSRQGTCWMILRDLESHHLIFINAQGHADTYRSIESPWINHWLRTY